MMSKRDRLWATVLVIAAILAGPSIVRAHGGGHGGGGHGGFHGGGFHGGYGFHHGWGGWGYAPFGFGLGLGLGYGFGYGIGYPYYGWNGYPYGYGGPYRYGVANPYWYGYGYPAYGYPYAPYSWYGYSAPYAANYRYAASAGSNSIGPAPSPLVPATLATVPAPPLPRPPSAIARTAKRVPTSDEFVKQGDDAFKRGNYVLAANAWRHALADDPQNGTLSLKSAQALFASSHYDEAAQATEQGLANLPSTHWGSVLRDRARLYGSNAGAYATELQALEKAAAAYPDNTAMHFLLAYQYAYSGRATEASELLATIIEKSPEHAVAQALHDTLLPKFAAPTPRSGTTEPASLRKPMAAKGKNAIDL